MHNNNDDIIRSTLRKKSILRYTEKLYWTHSQTYRLRQHTDDVRKVQLEWLSKLLLPIYVYLFSLSVS